jgi:hypothetical protein
MQIDAEDAKLRFETTGRILAWYTPGVYLSRDEKAIGDGSGQFIPLASLHPQEREEIGKYMTLRWSNVWRSAEIEK